MLTLVAAAHTEGMGTVDDVAIEKGALLAALPPSGLAVVNADDPRAVAQLSRSPARDVRTYGFGATADYRITARQPLGLRGTTLAVERSGARIEAQSPLLGDAGALAVAASLAVADADCSVVRSSKPSSRPHSADLVAGGEGRLSPALLPMARW